MKLISEELYEGVSVLSLASNEIANATPGRRGTWKAPRSGRCAGEPGC